MNAAATRMAHRGWQRRGTFKLDVRDSLAIVIAPPVRFPGHRELERLGKELIAVRKDVHEIKAAIPRLSQSLKPATAGLGTDTIPARQPVTQGAPPPSARSSPSAPPRFEQARIVDL